MINLHPQPPGLSFSDLPTGFSSGGSFSSFTGGIPQPDQNAALPYMGLMASSSMVYPGALHDWV